MQKNPTVGILIRFSDSAVTLPAVLEGIRRQTRQPDYVLGVSSHSTDQSGELLKQAGAEIVEWKRPYHHSRVLNFGLRNLHTDLVLILSSHTVLEAPDTIENLVSCFEDYRVACASAKWDDDPFYGDTVDWHKLQKSGIRFGSIYSNSMGMIRRCLWENCPFDETIDTSEDYAWALEQLQKGYLCRRLDFPFRHQRGGNRRDYEFANIVFQFAQRFGLKVSWLGPKASLKYLLQNCLGPNPLHDSKAVFDRLRAYCVSLLRPRKQKCTRYTPGPYLVQSR